MKCKLQLNRLAGVWAVPLLLAGLTCSAAEQRTFASPEEAIQALKSATASQDKTGLHELFGPEFDQIQTGDKTQDEKNAEKFAAALSLACKPVPEGQDMITLEIGTNEWPMPIPLVKVNGQWHFDTAAGKDEIIMRHIGKDELHAIGVCRAYVKAQQQYASQNAGPDSSYAMRFKSTSGKKDGLYWPAADNVPASPFGPVVADAQADDYLDSAGLQSKPFHGYFFRILTRQGPAAPGGKKSYMSQGMLAGGFALVAYPESWDKSGIMTFIVNQDGIVYERNFGPKTSRIAKRLNEYNPDNNWKLVQDEGMLSAASEKRTQ
jgi:hypothetical protein